MSAQMYFIGIIPPGEIAGEITAYKEYAALHFSSSRALRSPAHLTLFPPFRWESEKSEVLEKGLEDFARTQIPFFLDIDGFSCFPPRVIFASLRPSIPLEELQKNLISFLNIHAGLPYENGRPYHPHITIAFKDLSRNAFSAAWAYFHSLEYQRRFEVHSLALLIHQGGKWQELRPFPFSEVGGRS